MVRIQALAPHRCSRIRQRVPPSAAISPGLDKHAGFEFGYVAGAYYHWKRWLSPGIEFYRGIGLID